MTPSTSKCRICGRTVRPYARGSTHNVHVYCEENEPKQSKPPPETVAQ